jgi:hypothetical protein
MTNFPKGQICQRDGIASQNLKVIHKSCHQYPTLSVRHERRPGLSNGADQPSSGLSKKPARGKHTGRQGDRHRSILPLYKPTHINRHVQTTTPLSSKERDLTRGRLRVINRELQNEGDGIRVQKGHIDVGSLDRAKDNLAVDPGVVNHFTFHTHQ